MSDTYNKADRATSSTHLGEGCSGLHNTLCSVSWDICYVQLHIAPCCNAMHIAGLACSLCCCPGSAVWNKCTVFATLDTSTGAALLQDAAWQEEHCSV